MHLRLGNFISLVVGTIATAALVAAEPPSKPGRTPIRAEKTISWSTDYAGSRARAKQSGKPALVVFTASWCPACRYMERTTFFDSKVIDQLENWVTIEVDVDKQKELAAKYNINALPTLMIIKRNGNGFLLPPGGKSPKELLGILQSVN